MATLGNGRNDAESPRRYISFQFQSRDLPSRRLLGKGLSGIAYETVWKGAKYARKDFVGVQRDIFVHEATVLVGLEDHKNIVKTYGWTVDKRSCSLVLEYMEEDLLSLLQKRVESKRDVVGNDFGNQSPTSASMRPVDLPEAMDMMLQIATGMEYLHDRGLAHGDLKTRNILVSQREEGDRSSLTLKLTDFGLAGSKRKCKYIVSRNVRKLDMIRWKAPEYLRRRRRTLNSSTDEDQTSSESESESTPRSVPDVSVASACTKSADVYSFAVACSQILTGRTPYPDLDWKELMAKILSGWRPELPVACHPLLRDLLISCWGDPDQRPSFSTVCMKLNQLQEFFRRESTAEIWDPVGIIVPPSEITLSQDFVQESDQASPTDDLVRRRASEADSFTEVSDSQWLEGGDTQLTEGGDTQWSELSETRWSEVTDFRWPSDKPASASGDLNSSLTASSLRR